MNVLLVHQSSDLYGSDRSFLSALEGMRAARPDARIDVILPDADGELAPLIKRTQTKIAVDRDGYLRKVFLRHPLRLVLALAKSYRRIGEEISRQDLVYVNTVVCISAILACRRHHNAWVHVRELPTGLSLIIFRTLLKLSKARLIYNSKATRDAFGLDGEVVYNGVESAITSNLQNGARLIKPSGGRRRFVIVGRVSEWKGQRFVIDALSQMDEPIELVILGGIAPGRDAYGQELRIAADRLKGHTVRFIDFASDPAPHYAWADFVLVPSLLPEPFGRVAVEAMSAGRPPVAANHGGLSEIIDTNDTGITFKPGDTAALLDAIKKCVSMDDEEYQKRADACLHAYRDRFTVAAYQKRLCHLLGLTAGARHA